MPKPSRPFNLTRSQREQIEHYLKLRGIPRQVTLRCHIVLAAAQGSSDLAIASALQVSRHTVRLWRTRFAKTGVKGLWEVAPGRGRKPIYGADSVKAIEATLRTKPEGKTRWSSRLMAKHLGISKSTVSRISQRQNLQLRRVNTFEMSRDRKWLTQLTDVLGLYFNPPEQAIVLCVADPTRIRAIEQTPPGLLLQQNRRSWRANDHTIHGDLTGLLTALELLQNKVSSQSNTRHRQQAFLRFLRRLDHDVARSIDLHVILEDTGISTSTEVTSWLKRHSRFVLHIVPPSASWLDLVTHWFRTFTAKHLRRGSFLSMAGLTSSIDTFLMARDEQPPLFVWTASVESIVATLQQIQSHSAHVSQRKQREPSP